MKNTNTIKALATIESLNLQPVNNKDYNPETNHELNRTQDKVSNLLKPVNYGEVLENAQNILYWAKTEEELANKLERFRNGINTAPVGNTIPLAWLSKKAA